MAKRPYLCRENLIILRTLTRQADYFNLPATGFCACAVYLSASALPCPVAPGGYLPTPPPPVRSAELPASTGAIPSIQFHN